VVLEFTGKVLAAQRAALAVHVVLTHLLQQAAHLVVALALLMVLLTLVEMVVLVLSESFGRVLLVHSHQLVQEPHK
jgi:hypothetical protein